MKRTSNGMERLVGRSRAPHPDFQARAAFNGPLYPTRENQAKPTGTVSWWAEPMTREAFRVKAEAEQGRMSASPFGKVTQLSYADCPPPRRKAEREIEDR